MTKIEAEEYAKQVGATHFLASAKNNKGIKDIFMHIAQSKHCQIESEVSVFLLHRCRGLREET